MWNNQNDEPFFETQDVEPKNVCFKIFGNKSKNLWEKKKYSIIAQDTWKFYYSLKKVFVLYYFITNTEAKDINIY